jgi:hypothetical protein
MILAIAILGLLAVIARFLWVVLKLFQVDPYSKSIED